MKILVTGGAGFIGSHVVDGLVEKGHTISVIDNLVSGSKDNLNKLAKFYEGDIKDSDFLRDVFDHEKPEVVAHLAAQKSVTQSVKDPVFDAQENIIGSLTLFEVAKDSGTKRIIFTSTGGALYGETTLLPTPESHPIFPESPYGIAKFSIENYLRFYAATYQIQTVVLRLANVYGPRQDPRGEAGVVAVFCNQIIKDQTPTIFGNGTRDYVYVGDVAQAFVDTVSCQANLIVNIGTGVESKVADLIKQLERASGHQVNPKLEPKRAGELQRSCLDYSLAKDKLNWQPEVSLEQGIKETYQWFKERAGSK